MSEGEAIDPRAEADRLRALDAERFDSAGPLARRRLATRVLDGVRARFAPLPRDEMLVGLVLALPDRALAHAALVLEAAAPGTPLGARLDASWARTAADAGELFSLEDGARGAAAFEGALGALARRLASRLSAEEALAETSRGEWLVRSVAQATWTPTLAGPRRETEERREQALARLDPADASATARRLAREERAARALAALDEELAGGGALPGAAAYGAL